MSEQLGPGGRRILIGLCLAAGLLDIWTRNRRAPRPPAARPRPDARPGTALVTGASSGIGAAFARRLAAEGYDLILVARRAERLRVLAADLEARHTMAADVLVADLSDDQDLHRVEERIAGCEDLALVIHAAGFGLLGTFAALDLQRQLQMIHVHVIAAVRLNRAALPGMIARGRGGIINVSSVGAFIPGPGNATYNATKAFLSVFSEAIQMELSGTGVWVQALCPGFTYTEFHDHTEVKPFDRTWIPKALWMSADDVAARSLEALRRGEVIYIPGVKNRVLVVLACTSRITPLWRAVGKRVRQQLGASVRA